MKIIEPTMKNKQITLTPNEYQKIEDALNVLIKKDRPDIVEYINKELWE